MKGIKPLILLLLLFLITAVQLQAQTREELERRRKEQEKEIEFTRKLISQTSEKQKQTVNHLKVLNRQIKSREELISTMQSEINLLNRQISNASEIIEALEQDIEALKEEYAQMLYFSHKNRNAYTSLTFIFSADDFNKAWQRLRFMQFISEFKKKQAELIRATQDDLAGKIGELKDQRAQKEELLQQQQNARQELVQDKSSQDKLVKQLKNKEADLKKQLREKEAAARKLNAAIAEIIKRELEEARKKDKSGSGYALTPEAQKLSADFLGNRGKLPWPVERGIISETFGRHAHPTLPNVYVENNGINIRTEKDAIARAVFEGEVSYVLRVPGAGMNVIIRHGDFFSVYSNLDRVFVKAKDKVALKSEIGTVLYNAKGELSELHFEIWKGTEKMNPETWIYKQ